MHERGPEKSKLESVEPRPSMNSATIDGRPRPASHFYFRLFGPAELRGKLNRNDSTSGLSSFSHFLVTKDLMSEPEPQPLLVKV